MQKIVATILGIAAFSALATGCTVESTPVEGSVDIETADTYTMDDLYESSVKLEDGREVTCVVLRGRKAGGVSCDWAGASENSSATD